MKSSIFAALVGIATAGGSALRSENGKYSGSSSSSSFTSTTTSYSKDGSTIGSGALSTVLPVYQVGGGSAAQLSGVSDLKVSSAGVLQTGGVATGSASGVGSSGLLSNVGTGAVLITSDNTGSSSIVSGEVISNGPYPTANIAEFNRVNAGYVNSNVLGANVINSALSTTVTSNKSIDSLFTKLPSSADLDRLILGADSVAILKTIQTIGTNESIPCDQRISYLLELQGRIQAAIAKKTYAATQLKVVIDGATAEITRLQGLIDAANRNIAGLGLDDAKVKLDTLVTQLQTVYDSYNRIQDQIPVLQAQVVGNTNEIDIINKNSDIERTKISNDKLKLIDVQTQIAALQAQLAALQDNQAALLASIQKSQTKIAENDKVVADLIAKVTALEAQIKDLNDKADTLNAQIKDFEVRVNRLRTDISVADAKKTKYLKDIQNLQDQIAIQRKLQVPDSLNKINDMINSLRKMLPAVQSEIDRHYYYCFGNGKVQVQQTGSVVVYVVRGDAFANYLRALYGSNVVLPAVNGDVLFNRVDIFGTTWVGAFGYPFGQSALGGNDLSLGGSFNCLNPNALVTGSGTITAIGADWVECGDGNGGRRRLSLGSCSRLESTHSLPAIGQKFYWSGVPAGSGFNLYAGTCLD